MLKNSLLASALALSAYAMSTSAEAGHRHQGWYVGIEAGATWIQDADLTATGTSLPVEAEFDTGFALFGEVGYRWEDNWRVELELGLRENDADCFRVGAPCVPNVLYDITQVSQMVNVLHDIPLAENTTLSLGLGIGGAFVDVDGRNWTDDGAYVFAGQALFQLAQALTDDIDLVVSYRFMTLEDPEFRQLAYGNLEMDTETHTVSLGLSFDLQPDPVAVEPVIASAPPAVEATPAPRQFIVFFAYNKSNLTREGLDIVREAAATAMKQGYVTILVTGHTDTSGSAAYNLALSERRADSVKKALVAQGIPAAGIEASGKGETVLAVQTQDMEKEPRNRRAEINLN
jgi:outer membrane protein OmpA-like peptidoglycan-associated protein